MFCTLLVQLITFSTIIIVGTMPLCMFMIVQKHFLGMHKCGHSLVFVFEKKKLYKISEL